MNKITLIMLLLVTLVVADSYKIKDFESDIFSKEGDRLKKISLSLVFEGRDLNSNKYKIEDALNVIVSSFYIEDLFTSKGKERFKALLIEYIAKKYGVDVDYIYILRFELKQNVDLDLLIKRLKNELPSTKFRQNYKEVQSAPKEEILLEE